MHGDTHDRELRDAGKEHLPASTRQVTGAFSLSVRARSTRHNVTWRNAAATRKRQIACIVKPSERLAHVDARTNAVARRPDAASEGHVLPSPWNTPLATKTTPLATRLYETVFK